MVLPCKNLNWTLRAFLHSIFEFNQTFVFVIILIIYFTIKRKSMNEFLCFIYFSIIKFSLLAFNERLESYYINTGVEIIIDFMFFIQSTIGVFSCNVRLSIYFVHSTNNSWTSSFNFKHFFKRSSHNYWKSLVHLNHDLFL